MRLHQLAGWQIGGYINSMAQTHEQQQPAAKRRGRPSLADGLETVPVTIRLTAEQRVKLAALGGAKWVRDRIDKARPPTE